MTVRFQFYDKKFIVCARQNCLNSFRSQETQLFMARSSSFLDNLLSSPSTERYRVGFSVLFLLCVWLIVGSFSQGLPNSMRSEEHTSELQSRPHLVCRLLLEKKKKTKKQR